MPLTRPSLSDRLIAVMVTACTDGGGQQGVAVTRETLETTAEGADQPHTNHRHVPQLRNPGPLRRLLGLQ